MDEIGIVRLLFGMFCSSKQLLGTNISSVNVVIVKFEVISFGAKSAFDNWKVSVKLEQSRVNGSALTQVVQYNPNIVHGDFLVIESAKAENFFEI